ncbi:CYTH and CHAD domain-containing protein [Bordetella avium]|uniref:CYTH and CHAD domain-containing protein n=1 Tax=Bordetella avium TaxID=521 RepID=UPI000E0C87B0|nr:CYTH and CHAD domain-containing protein [Bordetella avium]AZY51506.1 inorganic triphosphatase [Bordetella avium]RIQ14639.1 CHAD domain-containing protein [Bordetella avium]RIQ40985.1 CHAD domain-containing protein [Bordetella avium]RIQ46223.1 CHAD domain-containing protein [Bordetella avium]RIQ47153.1 CHAD domain-containing protein [Bordetella avium]
MSEQELKLHVPAASVEGVRQEIAGRQATRLPLRAMYFDTPERELVKARIALRLRQEGENWVQTVKMPGANAITRIELNHVRPGPVLDLSVYAGTAVGDALARIQGQLGVRYETDVQRLLCKLRSREGSVEAALDLGVLRAGGLELPICEIEFELMSGRPEAIFSIARGWQQRHGLVLDVRSKSERGDALAQLAAQLALANDEATAQQIVARFWAPRGARAVALTPDLTPEQAMARVADECLEQIIRNAAMVAEVDTAGVYQAGSAEHVHQLRVGMRRLRSAWRLFEGAIETPPETLDAGIREYFGALGASRDQDVLADTIAPLLRQAGMPDIPTEPVARGADARSLCSGAALQGWLLDLYQWSMTVRAAPVDLPLPVVVEGQPFEPAIIPLDAAPAQAPLRPFLIRRLRRWHKQVVTEGMHFSELDLPTRHELRKRAKRLRYGLAFAESLLPNARLRSYRKQLALVQELLGEINDLAVAAEHYKTQIPLHPQAWFALGWIALRLEQLAQQAQPAFEKLAKDKRFWKAA